MDMAVENGNKFQVKDPMSALTHFIGFLAVIPVGSCLMEQAETRLQMAAFMVFSIPLLLLYGASTIYHTLKLYCEKSYYLLTLQ